MHLHEPLQIRNITEGILTVSRLKNVELALYNREKFSKQYNDIIVNILKIFADDLITINGGDYDTHMKIEVDDFSLMINVQKSYPFIYIDQYGPVENLNYEFYYERCNDDASIHQTIDEEITRHMEESSNNWLYAKPYSVLPESQTFYKYLRYIDQLLFDKSTVVKACSFMKSIYFQYDNEKKLNYDKINNLGIIIHSTSSPHIVLEYGMINMVVTDKGLLMRSSRIEDQSILRKVFNTPEVCFQDVKESFIDFYNAIYETNHTDTKDLALVHDMISI